MISKKNVGIVVVARGKNNIENRTWIIRGKAIPNDAAAVAATFPPSCVCVCACQEREIDNERRNDIGRKLDI